MYPHFKATFNFKNLTSSHDVCSGCKVSGRGKKKCGMKTKCHQRGIFGVHLEHLISEDKRLPQVIEDLLSVIEMKGLFSEGLYRKSATASKISDVKGRLDRGKSVDLDAYSIHVLTGVVKAFLRELPDPVMTFDLYDEFLWAGSIPDQQERVTAVFSVVSRLPRSHLDLLDRLTLHMTRIAQHEEANRMNANNLAIVMAPCMLRTDRITKMQDKLDQVSKQTSVLETIIVERMKQERRQENSLTDSGLSDLFDSSSRTASSSLSSIGQSTPNLHSETSGSHSSLPKSPTIVEVINKDRPVTYGFRRNRCLSPPSYQETMMRKEMLARLRSDLNLYRKFDDIYDTPKTHHPQSHHFNHHNHRVYHTTSTTDISKLSSCTPLRAIPVRISWMDNNGTTTTSSVVIHDPPPPRRTSSYNMNNFNNNNNNYHHLLPNDSWRKYHVNHPSRGGMINSCFPRWDISFTKDL